MSCDGIVCHQGITVFGKLGMMALAREAFTWVDSGTVLGTAHVGVVPASGYEAWHAVVMLIVTAAFGVHLLLQGISLFRTRRRRQGRQDAVCA